MAEANRKDNSQPIEYSIYTYDFPQGEDRKNSWEKQLTTEDMDEAIKKAEGFFGSGDYLKVEVKKKYFEEKTGRTIDMTLRMFESREKKDYSLYIFIVLALVAGIAAFGLTFFIGGGQSG